MKSYWKFVKSLQKVANKWRDETNRTCWGTWDTFETLVNNLDDEDDVDVFSTTAHLTDQLEAKIAELQDDEELEDSWINSSEMSRTDAEVSIILKGSPFFNKVMKMSKEELKKLLLQNDVFEMYNFGHLCVAYCSDKGWECEPECDCIFDTKNKTITEKQKSSQSVA